MTLRRAFLSTFAVACVANLLCVPLAPESFRRAALIALAYLALFTFGALARQAGARFSLVALGTCAFFAVHMALALVRFLAASHPVPGQARTALLGVLFVSPALALAFLAVAALGFFSTALIQRRRQRPSPAA